MAQRRDHRHRAGRALRRAATWPALAGGLGLLLISFTLTPANAGAAGADRIAEAPAAAQAQTATVTCQAFPQEFSVPPDVTSLGFTAVGGPGSGGNNSYSSLTTGNGAGAVETVTGTSAGSRTEFTICTATLA